MKLIILEKVIMVLNVKDISPIPCPNTPESSCQQSTAFNNQPLPDIAKQTKQVAEKTSKPKKKKSARCNHPECSTKLKLSDIVCRCGLQFCSEHRYSDKHNCSYDYREFGKKELTKNNPQIICKKV